MRKISIVAALSAQKGVVGNKNKLLWHIPDDLKRFKALTLGHPVILGSKTYESIASYLGGPLPGRLNIVLTLNKNYSVPAGVVVRHSLDEAIQTAEAADTEEIFIGGGPNVWQQVLPRVTNLYLTLVEDEPAGDAFFPDYSEFKKISGEEKREHNGLKYSWINFER